MSEANDMVVGECDDKNTEEDTVKVLVRLLMRVQEKILMRL